MLNGNVCIGILISLLGGFLASFSPCSLSTLPIIIGYVSNTNDKKNNLKYSIIFALGTTITFVILGVISVLLGNKLNLSAKALNIILAIILILLSLNMFGVIGPKNTSCKVPSKSKNIFKAFFLGILGGLLSSPCTAPILIAILSFTAVQGNLLVGVLYMLAYSIGNSIIIILAGTSMSFVQKLTENEKYNKVGRILKYILGTLSLAFALYFLYLVF